MLTRQQKEEQIKLGIDNIKQQVGFLLADFSRVKMGDLQELKVNLRKFGSGFKIIKKRLLKIILRNLGVDFDPTRFDAQAALIMIPNEIPEIAGVLDKFSKKINKEGKSFSILGGFDLRQSKEITVEEFVVLAKLPSREALLSQLAVMLSMPIKQLAHALNVRAKGI